MNLTDTHCHLNFDMFDADRDEVLKRAKEAGVHKMVSIGCRVEDARKTLELVKKYEDVYAAVSIHPCDIEDTFTDDFAVISDFATHDKVVAIGETGLDFFRSENPTKKAQVESFRMHAELAKKLQKPLIIHSRSARQETLEILKTLTGFPFVWHCFSEDMATAEEVFVLGGMISFTGVVTFSDKNAPRRVLTEIQMVARNAPLERIMVETDAPFLAPLPHRGKRCEPAFVKDTAAFIAALRGMDILDFAEVTTENAQRFFGI